MNTRKRSKQQGLDIKTRWRQVEACLQRHGLAPGPRLVDGEAERTPAAARLSAALSELGPVFARFGRFLSRRADLLPAEDCWRLQRCRSGGESEPCPTAADLARQALAGCGAELRRFGEAIGAGNGVHRVFVACFHDGAMTATRVVDPGFAARWPIDGALLRRLGPALNRVWPEALLDGVADDFSEDISGALELEHWPVAKGTEGSTLALPARMPGLSTSEALTVERFRDALIADVLGNIEAARPKGDASIGGMSASGVDLARHLWLAWFRQVFTGAWFPVCPEATDLGFREDGEIAYYGGPVSSLSPETQTGLLAYLAAVAADRPDEACRRLLRYTRSGGAAVDVAALMRRFRQIVPFRDGPWSRAEAADSLAERLFVQWRVIGQFGLRPAAELADFQRSLTAVALTTRRLAPERDVFCDALYEFRFQMGARDLGRLADAGELTAQAERFFTMAAEFPQLLEGFLADSPPERADRRGEPAPVAPSTPLGAASWLIVLLSVAMLTRFLTVQWGDWVEPIGAAVFVAAGGWLLRVIMRT